MTLDLSDQIHVIPVGDLRDHEPSPQCWCLPKNLDDEPSVWVHNALDGRERYENGEIPLQ